MQLLQSTTQNQYYQNYQKNLKEKRPKLAQKNVLFLHDNAPAHTAALAAEFLSMSRVEVMTPAYSPDL